MTNNNVMLDKEGFIIGSQIITNLELLSLFGPEKEERIRKRISPDTLVAIQSTSKTIYVPVQYDIELTEAVQAEVGDDGLVQWSKDAFNHSLNSSLLGPMLRGMIRLFNVGPRSLVKFAPRAWQHIYKNGGLMTFTKEGQTFLEVGIANLPLSMLRSKAYMLGVTASFQAVVEVTKTKGKVVMKPFSLETGDAFWEISWEKAKR